jgi:dTDP-4-amino-4,6-dideoxygalactose transaminase
MVVQPATKMNWKIPLTEPDLGHEEIEAVTSVLQSKWLTMGEVTFEFERQFAERMRVKHAIAVCNCTAALHLAHLAIDIRPGDEVICPALTFVATANAARYTGAHIVFADVESVNDLTISVSDIEQNLTARTKAIVVVHYAGFCCQMQDILRLAHRHGLRVVEDCAHAPFAQYQFSDGRREYAGAMGDVGCFSFFGNKNMTTGEGGMVTTNDDVLADRIRLLRSHGMTSLTYARNAGHAGSYDVVALGYNYQLDEIRSAIGIAQLSKIDELNRRRRQVYSWYLDAFRSSTGVRIPFGDRSLDDASCHILPIMVSSGAEAVRRALRDARIQSSRHYDLITSFSEYADREFRSVLPVHELLTLPLSPFLTRDQVQEIASIVISVTQCENAAVSTAVSSW